MSLMTHPVQCPHGFTLLSTLGCKIRILINANDTFGIWSIDIKSTKYIHYYSGTCPEILKVMVLSVNICPLNDHTTLRLNYREVNKQTKQY